MLLMSSVKTTLTLNTSLLCSGVKMDLKMQSTILIQHTFYKNLATISSRSASSLFCVRAVEKRKKNPGVCTQSWLCRWDTKWFGLSDNTSTNQQQGAFALMYRTGQGEGEGRWGVIVCLGNVRSWTGGGIMGGASKQRVSEGALKEGVY